MEQTYYVSIGNTDNKLSQEEWASFCSEVNNIVRFYVYEDHIYGEWYSETRAPWQNACWGFSIGRGVDMLKEDIRKLASKYRQDAIAWAEVKEVEFLS